MAEIKTEKLCKCEKCGNEAEMVVTCSLPDSAAHEKDAASGVEPSPKKKESVKGTFTCTHCGNEADMWIDL
ncbi:MAG: hypothetical protein R6U50_16305 [Desulfobacterales bacterium]